MFTLFKVSSDVEGLDGGFGTGSFGIRGGGGGGGGGRVCESDFVDDNRGGESFGFEVTCGIEETDASFTLCNIDEWLLVEGG